MFGINSSNENININNEESNMDNINVNHETSDVAWRMIVTNLRAERDSWEQRFHALTRDCDGMSQRLTQMEQTYKRDCDEYERCIANMKDAAFSETLQAQEWERRYDALKADFDGALSKIDTMNENMKSMLDAQRKVDAQQRIINEWRTHLCDDGLDNITEPDHIDNADKPQRKIMIDAAEIEVDADETIEEALARFCESMTKGDEYHVEIEYDAAQRAHVLKRYDLLSLLHYTQARMEKGADIQQAFFSDSMALLKHDIVDALMTCEECEAENED
jgi:hypothetical protein